MEPQERDLVLRETKPQNDVAAATVIPASLIPALNGFDASHFSPVGLKHTIGSIFAPAMVKQHHRHMSPDQNTPQDLSVGSGGRNSEASSSAASSLHSATSPGAGGGADNVPTVAELGRLSPREEKRSEE
ncbi:hypothetical protein BV898_19829 [Hypsibius exemplaris]|uniref:Uncharacterized protein n=1 Tax=Hypsibius exemplaris TaxID=2072580 RepID=A0A9X6NKC6_HYPEX|nr:hypothetical protein BV898_19829 [Hypsibius exemplaris]